ncbi:MAG: pyridoxamine 5'-phosphate oxidase [Chloroflexota bacterium]
MTLTKSSVPSNPIPLFTQWRQDAFNQPDIHQANAMTLATTTSDGVPSARIVLLREFDEHRFCFYTNYESRKGQEIAQNAHVSLLFYWDALGRQVRIDGTIAKMTAEESDAYYQSRPLDSQLGAWVSPQSQVIDNRVVLEDGLAGLQAKHGETAPPRPPFWGGYRVYPTVIEFWQHNDHRLHDRIRYTRQPDDTWTIERLAP